MPQPCFKILLLSTKQCNAYFHHFAWVIPCGKLLVLCQHPPGYYSPMKFFLAHMHTCIHVQTHVSDGVNLSLCYHFSVLPLYLPYSACYTVLCCNETAHASAWTAEGRGDRLRASDLEPDYLGFILAPQRLRPWKLLLLSVLHFIICKIIMGITTSGCWKN